MRRLRRPMVGKLRSYRRLKQISALSDTGEGKVSEEWMGEASEFGF